MSVVKAKGIKRVINAVVFSLQGLRCAVYHEEAFRQEIILAVLLIPLAFWLEVSIVERLLLIASVMMVLIVELLNSGIEAVVDRVGTEYNELAGRAKDLGSAAVFLSLLMAGFIWIGIVFFR